MGLFDRFRGAGVQRPALQEAVDASDDQAIARYRYMLRTAPPDTIEQAHAEAFAQLTPEQRRRVLEELARDMPAGERAAAMRAGEEPGALARAATRAEIRNPGAIERTLGAIAFPSFGAAAPGFGSALAGSFLASMAGTIAGSMIARHFFASQADGVQPFGDVAHDGGDASRYADIGEPSFDGSATDGGFLDDGGGAAPDFGDGGTFDV